MICSNIDRNAEGRLTFGGVDTAELARKHQTPLYLMDEDRIRHNCRLYTDGMKKAFPHGGIVAYAKERGVNVAVEGVAIFVINSPEKMARLVNDLGEDNVKVIFDPVNYVSRANIGRMDEIIESTFELLSDRLVAIHAKDYRVNDDGKIVYPDPALGELNYKLIFECMKRYGVDVPIIMEGIPEDRAAESFERLERIKASV